MHCCGRCFHLDAATGLHMKTNNCLSRCWAELCGNATVEAVHLAAETGTSLRLCFVFMHSIRLVFNGVRRLFALVFSVCGLIVFFISLLAEL